MRTLIIAAVLCAAMPAFADGYDYQDGSTANGYSGFNYQEPPPAYEPPSYNPCYPYACANDSGE